jgi:integrase
VRTPFLLWTILAIIENRARVPRFKGRYLFSTTHGESPTHMSSKVKDRINELMVDELRKLAEQRGDDPSKLKLASSTNHDIRRTVRARLSRLKIAEEAREAVLAHVKRSRL